MTSLYPSIQQFTPENVQGWIGRFGPVREVKILNPKSDGQPFELELVLGV